LALDIFIVVSIQSFEHEGSCGFQKLDNDLPAGFLGGTFEVIVKLTPFAGPPGIVTIKQEE
jgi:hypothetical protein